MTPIDKYLKDNIRLIKSLVIYIPDVDYQINKAIGSNLEDLNTKYKLNLMGMYHITDLPIRFNSLEDGNLITLTLENKNNYPDTIEELKLFGDFYKSVVKLNKNETLLKGILYPVSIDTFVESNEYKIVNYEKSLILSNEVNLVNTLNSEIENYIERWLNKDFIDTDEYYLPLLMSSIFSNLLLKLLNYRNQKVFTYEVHDLHINEFFKNNLNILEDSKHLNKNSKIWLYKNLRYIMDNLGKNKTLDLYIENVLLENDIKVFDLKIDKLLKNVNGEIINSTGVYYKINRFNNDKFILDVKDVTDKQYTKLNKNSDIIEYNWNYLNKKILSNSNSCNTKSLILSNSKKEDYLYTDDIIYILNVLVENIDLENKIEVSFKDKKGYFTYKEIFNYVIYLHYKHINKKTNTEVWFNLTKIINRNVSPVKFDNEIEDYNLIEDIPNVNIYELTISKFKDKVNELKSHWRKIKNIISNRNDKLLHSNLKNKINQQVINKVKITDNLEDTIFNINNTLKISYSDDNIKYLFELITGYKLFNIEDLNNVLNTYVSLTDKFITYTTQILPDLNKPLLKTHYKQSNILIGDGPIKILDADFKCLDQINTTLDMDVNIVNNKIYVFDDNYVKYKNVKYMEVLQIAKYDEFEEFDYDIMVSTEKRIFPPYKPTLKSSIYKETNLIAVDTQDYKLEYTNDIYMDIYNEISDSIRYEVGLSKKEM